MLRTEVKTFEILNRKEKLAIRLRNRQSVSSSCLTSVNVLLILFLLVSWTWFPFYQQYNDGGICHPEYLFCNIQCTEWSLCTIHERMNVWAEIITYSHSFMNGGLTFHFIFLSYLSPRDSNQFRSLDFILPHWLLAVFIHLT